MSSNTIQKKQSTRFSRYDLAAFLILVFFAVFYIYKSFRSIQLVDETFFLTIPHRLLLGDRLIVDEWQVSQFSSVLQFLPFRIFYSLTGGTEGIVIYFRRLFIVFRLLICVLVYRRIRNCRPYSLAALFLLAAFVPINIMTLNYYTLSFFFSELICLLLFCSKKPLSPLKLIVCGVLMAAVVLSDPLTAFIFFAYTVLTFIVLLLKKKRDKNLLPEFGYLLNIKSWAFITVGVLISAAAFWAFLLSRSSLPDILNALPDLFTDSEYEGFDLSKKYELFLRIYRLWELVAAGLIIVWAFSVRKKKKSGLPVILTACAFSLLVSILMLVYADRPLFYKYAFYFQRLVPIVFAALVCTIVNRDIPAKLNAFLLFGMLVSLSRDIASDVSFGFSAGVMIVPAVLILGLSLNKVFNDLFSRKRAPAIRSVKSMLSSKMIPRAEKFGVSSLCIILSLLMLIQIGSFAVLSGKTYLKENTFFTRNQDALDTVLPRGPMKGIRTTSNAARIYNSMLSDIDTAKEHCDGPVYVAGIACWLYLYAESPYSAYSTWFVDEDLAVRQTDWWISHPDKRPGIIYIPIYNHDTYEENREYADAKLDFFKTVCSGEILESETGYTILVKNWKQ